MSYFINVISQIGRIDDEYAMNITLLIEMIIHNMYFNNMEAGSYKLMDIECRQ